MFNSSLPYELPVLKRYAEPLLKEIKSDHPQYDLAQELLDLLSHFMPVEDERSIPPNSLIREFIGNSCFYN